MGRQFSVYLLPSDAIALIDQLRNRFGAKVLLDYSPAYELFEIESPIRENPAKGSKPATKSIRCYLAPRFGHIERRYCPQPNWWVIDTDSEAIEFSGCQFDGNTLLIGRFWYWPNFVRNSEFVPKSAEFLKWAEAVYRFTKKQLRYEPKLKAYVGEDAMKFHQQGGQLASLIRADGGIVPA